MGIRREIRGEAGKGGVFLGRGNENLQRGKAVTLFSFTFPYRILNILITHSRFASNTAFLLLTADCFPSQGEELVYRGILTF